MKRKWKWLIVFLLSLVCFGLWFYGEKLAHYWEQKKSEEANKEALLEVAHRDSVIRDTSTSEALSGFQRLPEKAYISGVPFVCQAPHQNAQSWEYHHASCEEAAVLQALFYAQGKDTIDPNEAHRIFLDMIAWQEKHFGVHKDIHADSVKMLIQGYFGLADDEVVIQRKATLEDLRWWVARGYPVIAPTYGRILRNPYYTPPGPEYHMLTVIGYTPDRLITHDVGTKRGKNFSYENDRFMKSMNREGADILILRLRKK